MNPLEKSKPVTQTKRVDEKKTHLYKLTKSNSWKMMTTYKHQNEQPKPCTRFLPIPNMRKAKDAIVYLRLIHDNCSRDAALKFCSKTICRTDITKKYDGPEEARSIKIKSDSKNLAQTSHINGWTSYQPELDLGRGFINNVDSIKVSQDYNQNLKKIVHVQGENKKQFIDRVQSLKTFYQNYKEESSFRSKLVKPVSWLQQLLALTGRQLYDKTRKFREALAVSKATNSLRTSSDSVFQIINKTLIEEEKVEDDLPSLHKPEVPTNSSSAILPPQDKSLLQDEKLTITVHPLSESEKPFQGTTLKRDSRRHSRRISDLMLLTEEHDKKQGPVLKIASNLNKEEKNIMQTYNQLGNYVEWVENLIKGTNYQRLDEQETFSTTNDQEKVNIHANSVQPKNEEVQGQKDNQMGQDAPLGILNTKNRPPVVKEALNFPEIGFKIKVLPPVEEATKVQPKNSKVSRKIKKKVREKTREKVNSVNSNKSNRKSSTEIMETNDPDPKADLLQQNKIMKVMKQSKDLSHEFNQAVFSSQNQKNNQRIQLALALGKKKSGFTTQEVKYKLRELDAEFETRKMENEVAKIHLFNNENLRRQSKIVQVDAFSRSFHQPNSARMSFRLKDMSELKGDDINPYKMVMSQTFRHHPSPTNVMNPETSSLQRLKMFRQSIGEKRNWRKLNMQI